VLTAQTASFVANAQSASNAVSAATASFANAFTVASTLTAQTLVVQTITSSVDFVTGSTRFGSLLGNTHVFSGSVTMNPNGLFVSSSGVVGIGTTTPATPLHLLTSGLPAIRLTLGSEARVHNINGINNGRDLNVLPFRTFALQTGNGIAEGQIVLNAYEDFIVGTGASYTTRLTIASTGAATFSSSVTASASSLFNANNGTLSADILTIRGGGGSGAFGFKVEANNGEDIFYTDHFTYNIIANPLGGKFGIGVTNPSGSLSIKAETSNTPTLVFQPATSVAPSAISNFLGTYQTFTVIGSNAYVNNVGGISRFNTSYAGCFIAFDEGEISLGVGSNGVTPSQKMRISTTGIVTISSSVANLFLTSVTNSDSTGEGIITNLNSSSSGKTFFAGYSTSDSAYKFLARSNGGLANFQANDVNLSDERTKKDIIPLESYWDKFKAIEIVKFKYKDQTHDDFNIGVIAQQVEAVAPEFVDIDGFGETPEDGIPYKTIYTSDLHHTTIKVLQEAMAKIEDLQSQINELKAQ
jgi:hypothetical protein